MALPYEKGNLWRKAPLPPLEGEVPNEREAEGFVREQEKPPVSPFGLTAFNRCMIATGNHNFERPAALCNTLSGEPRRLRRTGRQVGDPYTGRFQLQRCDDGDGTIFLFHILCQKRLNVPGGNLPVDFREAEIVEAGVVIGAHPEGRSVHAVQPPNAPP